MYLCFANTESRRRAEDNAFFRAVFRAGAIVSNRCVADAQQTEKMAFEIVETLFRGICVGVAASITVGPVAVLCIQRTLSKSRRSGIVSGIGVACADTFMAMAALFFYSMLQTQIEQYNTLLRVIGGIFVVIVGVFIFAQNPVPQIRRNRAGKTSLWQDFASIFGLTIANFIMVIPYILAFFAVFKISGGDMADHTFGGFMRSLFVIAGFFGLLLLLSVSPAHGMSRTALSPLSHHPHRRHPHQSDRPQYPASRNSLLPYQRNRRPALPLRRA